MEKGKLVPKLRFPEFRSEWEVNLMGKLFSFKGSNSFSRDQLNYETGSVKNIHYGDIHTKFHSHFKIEKERVPFINKEQSLEKINAENYCLDGDIIFVDASEDINDIGKCIEIVNLGNQKVLSGQHTILTRLRDKKLFLGFGGYLFQCSAITNQIKQESQGTKVLGLSSKRLSKIKIFYPSNINEQQKIADCLTLLDELITTENEKLDALKTHKKGLMQQLFPREGESVPRLRFPEFEDAGEWEKSTLKTIFSIFQGFAFSSKDSVNNGVRWLKIADVSIQTMNHESPSFLPQQFSGLHSKFIVKQGDFVVALTRPILNGELKIAEVDETFQGALLNQRVGKLVTNHNIKFVYYLLQTKKLISDIEKNISGTEPPNLSTQQIENITSCIPGLEEQKYIADFLTTLDLQIIAQTERIKSLSQHKKGLMQQLFPD